MKDKTEWRKKQDTVLWDTVTKDVVPLKDKNTIYRGKEKEKRQVVSDNKNTPRSDADDKRLDVNITIKTLSEKKHEKSADIDRRTQQRLKRGKMSIDGRLDLHGMTQGQAYDALQEYIPAAYASGKRCILIITGKGQPRHGDPSLIERSAHIGVLKQKTPQWLSMSPLSPYILDIQPARPNHGGEGALYVLLRRRR